MHRHTLRKIFIKINKMFFLKKVKLCIVKLVNMNNFMIVEPNIKIKILSGRSAFQ